MTGLRHIPVEQRRTCVTCEVIHFENCIACFGFGVLGFTLPSKAPVSAHAAEVFRSGREPFGMKAFPCPVCRSTIAGLPDTPLAVIPHPTEYGRRQRPVITDERYATRLAIAFCDGAYIAVEQLFKTWERDTNKALHRAAAPRYEGLRDFLRYDEGIEPVLAMKVAMHFTRWLYT